MSSCMDTIMNEDNLWLDAIKTEDKRNYFEAFVIYLKYSSECLKKNSFGKGALSCSCAASCLVNLGYMIMARQLYMESARIYEENADSTITESIKESLWSLEQAYECYLLGGNSDKAQMIYDRSIFLARKINPIFGGEDIMKSLAMKKKHVDTITNMSNTNLQISVEVEEMIQGFMRLRKSNLNADKE